MRTRASLLALAASAAGLSSAPPPDIGSLAQRARVLRASWGASVASQPGAFDSGYERGDEGRRDWANWLIEGRLMLGQYPHMQPSVPGPTTADSRAHLRRVLSSGVDCFVSLQDELPPQDDASSWPADGALALAGADARAQWPAPFVRYAPDADAIYAELVSGAKSASGGGGGVRYLHCPIVDLSVPRTTDALFGLLDGVLAHYERGGGGVYVHCWGGRGRAGLVGGCLLALLCDELDADAVLREVQAGYDARAGAGAMPTALKRSPQTEAQRKYLASIVKNVRARRRYDNDMGMMRAGMPKGFI